MPLPLPPRATPCFRPDARLSENNRYSHAIGSNGFRSVSERVGHVPTDPPEPD